jgi:2-dehydro-3-deoxygluconokinase
MAAEAAICALVVGAITRDLDASDRARSHPGGVVFHAGLALVRLGAVTRVVTRVNPADAYALLRPLHVEGIETAALPSAETTTYLNDYSSELETHELRAVSDPIGPSDVPADWRTADLIHLGPLHRRDILPEVPSTLRGFKGLDLQGLVREPGPGGTRLAACPDLARYLDGLDVLQASESELAPVLEGDSLERFARRHGLRELIVTRGARGTTLLVRGERLEIPALATRALYPVGAGDVFLASYLFLRAAGSKEAEAARGAARVCAAKLEGGEVPKGFRASSERR